MTNDNIKKIAVAGTGYVGLSIATLLSQHHEVVAVDVIQEKVDLINNRHSPIQDEYIEKYLSEKELNLKATTDGDAAYKDADFVVIATPTNYDPVKNYFDTSHVEEVIQLVKEVNPEAIMVIKSTIPVGYTENIRKKMDSDNIIFAPEFLRESKALYDNLYPSRIIIGRPKDNERLDKAAHTFAALLQEGAIKENIETSHIPVILLTAWSTDEGRTEGYKAGADAYIAKPFDMEVLLARISNLLEKQEKRKQDFSHSISLDPKTVTDSSPDEAFLNEVIGHIEKNIDNSEYTIDSLAGDVVMSRMSFYRKMKSLTGQTPADFIRTVRLKTAAKLLKEGNCNVSEACYRTGFASPQNFSKHFKEIFGVLPSQYS